MTKDINLIPELRFPEFVGEWDENKMKSVFSLFNGYAFKSNDSVTNGSRWVKIADIGINRMKHDTPSYLPSDFIDKYPKFLLKEGDYVIALTRPILNNKLKIAKIDKESNYSLLNQRVARLESKHDIEFVYQLLQQQNLISKIDNRIAGTDPPNLSPNEINNVRVSIPIHKEQQKIATFLTSLDKRIALLSKKREKLKGYKKGVMQRIFSQEIAFDSAQAVGGVNGLPSTSLRQRSEVETKRDEDLFQNRSLSEVETNNAVIERSRKYPDWEVKKLGEVFDFIYTNSFSRSLLNYESGDIKNIHYGDIHTKFKSCFDIEKERVPFINSNVDIKNIKDNQFCKEGDLIIADASEDYKDIGKSIEVINLNNQKLVAGLHTYIARSKVEMALGFKAYLMQSENIRKQIMKIASGISVLGISKGNLSQITMYIPIYIEQQKIASFLSSLDRNIEKVSEQIDKSKAFKKGLLQRMFV